MTPQLRADVVSLAFRLYQSRFPGLRNDKAALCVATCFIAATQEVGWTGFEIQAGSAFFKCAPEGESKHYGYEFNEADVLTALKRDGFPLMHVWVADVTKPNAPEVVDLATGFQFELARAAGIAWHSSLIMEKHYWGEPDGERMIYLPDEWATKLAYVMACGLSAKDV